MSIRERILATIKGDGTDELPYMLDLSHWFYQKYRRPWDLSVTYGKPETELIEYHKRHQVGFYMPNLAHLFEILYPDDVLATVRRSGNTIAWSYSTPVGLIQRERVWEDSSYSWAIRDWSIKSKDEIRVLVHALSGRSYRADWGRYRAWADAVGEDGVVYLPFGYSAMGQLLNYWMGVERTVYALQDWPDFMNEAIDRINANNLVGIEFLCDSPADIVILGDNFSSDIQPPSFFSEYSGEYYREAIRRLHDAGKHVAVHIDGRLRGAIRMIRDVGADIGDAITPKPLGDLAAAECGEEAGDAFVLSGGISPELWLPTAPIDRFDQAVRDWFDLSEDGHRIIVNAGDQVPVGAEESRIDRVRDLLRNW